jgi:hypothetical protein
VVASLWKVSDISTAELMRRFYRAMERDKLAPGDEHLTVDGTLIAEGHLRRCHRTIETLQGRTEGVNHDASFPNHAALGMF